MTKRHFERGTTMVETALVLGVLLLVLFGIMDFGRLMYTYHMVNNAARIGARFAIVHGTVCSHYVSGPSDTWPCPGTQSNAQTEVASYVSQQSTVMGLGPIPTSNVTTAYNQVAGCQPANVGNTFPNGETGCQVSVTVTYNYNFFLPFMPSTTIPLVSTSKMLISQ